MTYNVTRSPRMWGSRTGREAGLSWGLEGLGASSTSLLCCFPVGLAAFAARPPPPQAQAAGAQGAQSSQRGRFVLSLPKIFPGCEAEGTVLSQTTTPNLSWWPLGGA